MKNRFMDNENYRLWWLLHQVRDVMYRARNKELSQYGITSEQAAALVIIKMLNNVKSKSTPGEISRWLLKEPHSVSRLVTRMEKDGLVSKDSGSGKRKNEVKISLTKKGEQAYNSSLKRESIQEVMSCLSEEECRQLSSVLEKLRDGALQNLTRRNKLPFP